jgi:hypothetical protein
LNDWSLFSARKEQNSWFTVRAKTLQNKACKEEEEENLKKQGERRFIVFLGLAK